MKTPSAPRSVAVVGGGIIGLMCAWYLRKAGADVTLLERGRVGGGCSRGNLGWVCPSISFPLPTPGLGAGSLIAALRKDSPLYIKMSAMPGLSRWLLAFRRHCDEGHYARGVRAMAELNGATLTLYDELVSEGLEFEYASAGLTFVSARAEPLEAERREIEAAGIGAVESWTPDDLAAREPGLPGGFAGALHVRTDRHVRADTVCSAVANALLAAGASIEEGFDVRVVRQSGSGVVIEGPSGSLRADAAVLAAGAETGRMAAPLGVRLPLQAGKGYSLTVHDPELRLRSPLYLCDGKIGLTPYRGRLRVGGTMELSGINRHLDRRRTKAIRRVASRAIPNVLRGGRVDEWVGMRPLTPDGLPVIGPLPLAPAIHVATGHQMLGITLAPSTGHALAKLMLEGHSDVDLEPFSPRRF